MVLRIEVLFVIYESSRTADMSLSFIRLFLECKVPHFTKKLMNTIDFDLILISYDINYLIILDYMML
jgi:hypothetical protein